MLPFKLTTNLYANLVKLATPHAAPHSRHAQQLHILLRWMSCFGSTLTQVHPHRITPHSGAFTTTVGHIALNQTNLVLAQHGESRKA